MQLDLGTKIRELRRREGRTQENLAEAIGVTAQAISPRSRGAFLSNPPNQNLKLTVDFFSIIERLT